MLKYKIRHENLVIVLYVLVVHHVLTLLVGTPSFQQHFECQCSCVWSGVKITESGNSMQLQARQLVASQNIMFTYSMTILCNCKQDSLL
jgi:hypothetical protein